MFRLNSFVRVGFCVSSVTLAWPVASVTDDGETMVVTASAIEKNLKDVLKEVSGVQRT